MLDCTDAQLSHHASRRATQRSIPERLQRLILQHADRRTPRPGGARVALITRRKLDRMRKHLTLADRERLDGAAILYDPASLTIITPMWIHGKKGQRYLWD